jgi:hypothetical protein
LIFERREQSTHEFVMYSSWKPRLMEQRAEAKDIGSFLAQFWKEENGEHMHVVSARFGSRDF